MAKLKPWDEPESVTIDIVVRSKYTNGVEIRHQISIDDSPITWEISTDQAWPPGTPAADNHTTVRLKATAPDELIRQSTLSSTPRTGRHRHGEG